MIFKTLEWRVFSERFFRRRLRLDQQRGAARIGGAEHIRVAVADEPDVRARRNAATFERHMHGSRIRLVFFCVPCSHNLGEIFIKARVFRLRAQ